MTESNPTKPEPIFLNVQGFDDLKPEPIIIQMESITPLPITMNSDINLKHDWFRLINTSPFQMYCCENYAAEGQGGHNIEDWIRDAIEADVLNDEELFFKKFSDWHTAKGYWPNETVYGELK